MKAILEVRNNCDLPDAVDEITDNFGLRVFTISFDAKNIERIKNNPKTLRFELFDKKLYKKHKIIRKK